MEAFDTWKTSFLKKRKTKAALDALRKYEDIAPELFSLLEERLLEACYNALRYAAEGDAFSKARKIKHHEIQQVAGVKRAIHKLLSHLQADDALSAEIMRNGMFLSRLDYDEAEQYVQRLATNLLSCPPIIDPENKLVFRSI